MTTLQNLRDLLEKIEDPSKAAGLRAFINLAEKLPPNASVLGKIQPHFVAMASYEAVAKATTFEEIREALGSDYDVTIEPVSVENRLFDKKTLVAAEIS